MNSKSFELTASVSLTQLPFLSLTDQRGDCLGLKWLKQSKKTIIMPKIHSEILPFNTFYTKMLCSKQLMNITADELTFP